MKTKNRVGWLLTLTLLVAACGGTEGSVSSTVAPAGTTATEPPATTNPSPSTTTESDEPTVIRPWGYDPVARNVEFSVIVPEGWDTQDGFIATGDVDDGTHMRLGGGMVGNLFADRCQWSDTTFDPGPTVEDLTTGFATIWGSDATTAIEVMVDGFEGKYMVLTVPADVNFSECDEKHFVGWAEAGVSDSFGPSRWYQGPGQVLKHWILDVNGVRLVIEASHFPQQSSEGLAELDRMVDSIQIVTG